MSFIKDLLTRAGLVHRGAKNTPGETFEETSEQTDEQPPSMVSVDLASLLEQGALNAREEQRLAESIGFDATFDQIYQH